MPLARQMFHVSLRQGLDTKSDPKQVIPTRLLALENGVLTQLGAVTKRPGYAALSAAVAGGGLIAAARALSTFKGELFLTSGVLGYAYAPSQGQWTSKGACEALRISATPAVRTAYQQTSQDSAAHPLGVTVTAWEDSSGGCRYAVSDTATGQPIVASAVLSATGAKPKCLNFGNYVLVVYYEGSPANHLRYVAVPVLAPQSPLAPADLALDVNAAAVYDAVVGGNRLFFAYLNTLGGTTQMSIRYVTPVLAVSNALLPPGVPAFAALGVFGDAAGNLWVAYGNPNVNLGIVDYNLGQMVAGPFAVNTETPRNMIGVVPSGETATVLYDVAASPGYNTVAKSLGMVWAPLPPALLSATAATGGTLAAGTYFYVVTAFGGQGETTRSNELSMFVQGGAQGSVALAWSAVPGAVAYRVYRGTAAGGEGTYYNTGNVLAFTDTGAAGTAGSPPSINGFLAETQIPAVACRSVGLASKPWVVNGSVHFLAGYTSALQPSYFVMSLAGGAGAAASVVGRLAPGVGGGLTAKAILPEVTQVRAGVFSLAYLVTDQIGAQAGIVLGQTGVNVATLDFTAPQAALELSDDLHLTGGMLHSFDGAQVVESNFHLFPENVSATPSGTGGLLTAGQYQYAVVWEWWDNFVLHQSAPSVPTTVTTTTAASSVALTIPTLRVTSKATPISIAVYRTAVNGTVFYRLTPPASPLANSTTADTVPYNDAAADSAIVGNAQLYTTGGEVENVAPPAPSFVCNYGSRMMLVSSENPLEIWFSKQVIQGLPVEFNPAFTITVDQRGGPVTALAQMDDKLVVFKQSSIFVMVGDGPAPNGLPVPAYPPPMLVAADSGCVSSKSLVLTPSGLMYQSAKGIYQFGRDLQTTYVGAPVEAYNGAIVTSAVQVPGTTQVRFTTDRGVALVYDWIVDQWSVFTNVAGADAAVAGGLYTYARSAGAVLQETPGAFDDAGNQIKLRLRTAWFSLAGLQAAQRVWEIVVLGEYRSAHNLRVSVAFDFDSTPQQVTDIPAASLLGQAAYGGVSPYGAGVYGGEFPLYQFRIRPARERCQAMQVTLEDDQSAPYGEGMALSALLLFAGTTGGPRKVPAGRTFGA